MHEQVREGRASRDTSRRRQNPGKGSHRDGEESRSQAQGPRRGGRQSWPQPSTELSPRAPGLGEGHPEVRMGGERVRRGSQGLQLTWPDSGTQAPVGPLWSLEFCGHWEKNQPCFTGPSTNWWRNKCWR